MSATVDPELLELVQEHVNQLSTDVNKMKFENQGEINNLWLVVKNIHEKLQVEHEKRFEKLERAQDVLQTNQDDLHDEIDAAHQQQSSTAVKVDRLQRVMELESHSNCGVSYGKYKLDNICLLLFPFFTSIPVVSNALHYCTGLWELT